MIKSARRFSLALILGASVLGTTGFASAQTATSPGTNGVTGTDPCPKNVACSVPPPTDGQVSPGGGFTGGTVAQALLVMLGLA